MAHYALGALRFALDGADAVARCIADEFACVRASSSDEAPHIAFTFVNELPPMVGATRVEPLTVADDAFAVTRNGLAYQVSQSASGIRVLLTSKLHGRVLRRAPAVLARFADWNHLTVPETVAKNFAYNVFDYLSQIAQLPLGQSHLHASAFERDGAGVAIIAWGGVGKTTTMLKLVLEDGWQYLSDDLVTIDASGTLWRSAKRLQIYAYNVENEDRLRRALMAGRGVTDRAGWMVRLALRGPKRVRRRIAAEQLFGRPSAVHAPLRHAIYTERADVPAFHVTDLTVTELVERATATVMRELDPFTELSRAMYSAGRHPVLPTVEEMYENTRAALARALSGVQPIAVTVPLHAGPDDIAGQVRRLLDTRLEAATR